VIEAEGFAYHGATPKAFNRDLRRYDELVRHGWRVLRFTWPQVQGRPQWVAEVVSATLARGPSAPAEPARR
jgi:very-short-patch-repair endonuclease